MLLTRAIKEALYAFYYKILYENIHVARIVFFSVSLRIEPFQKYLDVFWDIQKFLRYLENVKS